MPGDLLSIATSGARAARAALDLTAQNIANANTEGYVRRTLDLAEIATTSGATRQGELALSGVRIAGVHRNADLFRQSEVRRTGADAARSGAQLQGLENIEAALEQARPYDAVVNFEASLRRLASDPTSTDLRSSVLGAADAMARSFNLASTSLDAVGDGARFSAQGGVDQVNELAQQLARTNLALARTAPGSGDRATLLDQRDALLGRIAGQAGVTTSFAADGQVELRLGGTNGPVLVAGGSAAALEMTRAADGTISFAIGADTAAIFTGELSGHAATLAAIVDTRGQLDAAANAIAGMVNTAQNAGADLAGNPGQPLFAGSGAGGLSLALSDSAGLATAPAGAGAGSLDGGNLAALIATLDTGGAARTISNIVYGVSARVADQRSTDEALGTIAATARIALEQQSGVDLDQEAANLIRFQQAFQASGRAMQAASTIFDTLLGISR